MRKSIQFFILVTFAMNTLQNTQQMTPHPAQFAGTLPTSNNGSGDRPPLFPEAMETISQALNMQEFNEYVLYKLPWIHTEGMAVDPRETLNETKAIMYAFKHITGITALPYQSPDDAVNIQRQYKELLRVVAAHFTWGIFNKGESARRMQSQQQVQGMGGVLGVDGGPRNDLYRLRNYPKEIQVPQLAPQKGIPNAALFGRP